MDREDYPAGVPCYVDTGRKDPGSAMDFYGGLFGWEFEDVAAGAPQSYYAAKLNGLLVAAIGEQPEWTGHRSGTPTSGSRMPTLPRRR